MAVVALQILSHFPAHPPPIPVDLWESPPHPCPYLPGRFTRTRALIADTIPPELYHAFMNANFRRSGRIVYQPSCAGCRACVSLRVPVETFIPNKSQRRVSRRNQDLKISINNPPRATDEKFELYARYQRDWHNKPDTTFDDFSDFLYESPVNTIEFEYRDASNRLLAIGICDECEQSLSSVYFYFDPAEAQRRLGTLGALREIDYARQRGIPFYYLGYFIDGCGAMEYKASFRPHEVLMSDGVWRNPPEQTQDTGAAHLTHPHRR